MPGSNLSFSIEGKSLCGQCFFRYSSYQIRSTARICLGSILFMIYINDFSRATSYWKHDSLPTTLHSLHAFSKDLDSLIHQINNEIPKFQSTALASNRTKIWFNGRVMEVTRETIWKRCLSTPTKPLAKKLGTFASRRKGTSTKERGRSARKQLKAPWFSNSGSV